MDWPIATVIITAIVGVITAIVKWPRTITEDDGLHCATREQVQRLDDYSHEAFHRLANSTQALVNSMAILLDRSERK